MTTFGIEWDTPTNIFIPDYAEEAMENIPEKGVLIQGNKWTITRESWSISVAGHSAERKNTDCICSLEAQLGVFYNVHDDTKFNRTTFNTAFDDFQENWGEYINRQELPVTINGTQYDLPILVATTISKTCYNLQEGRESQSSLSKQCNAKQVKKDCLDTSGCNWNPVYDDKYHSDCAMKDSNSFIIISENDTDYQTNKAYTNISQQIKGVPQITIGFKLIYCESLFNYTTNIAKNWYDDSKPGTLGNPNGLEIIKQSIILTKSMLENEESLYYQYFEFNGPLPRFIPKVKNLLLLCNYSILIRNWKLPPEEQQKPFKYRFFYKIRTNLLTIYNSFINEERTLFDNIVQIYLTNYYDKTITEWFEKFYTPLVGYIINQVPPNIHSMVPKLGIYSITPELLSDFKTQGVQYKETNYTSEYPAPNIILSDNKLKYENDQQILDFDIGEWHIDSDNIVLEIRALPTVEQLAIFNKTTNKVVVDRGKKIIDVKDLVNIIIDYFLNKALGYILGYVESQGQ
jgi:hypothetical protein